MGIVKKTWTKTAGVDNNYWSKSTQLRVIPDTQAGTWRLLLTINTQKRGFKGLTYTQGSTQLQSTCTKNGSTYYIWLKASNNFANLKGTCYKSGYVDPDAVNVEDWPVGDDPLEGTFSATYPPP